MPDPTQTQTFVQQQLANRPITAYALASALSAVIGFAGGLGGQAILGTPTTILSAGTNASVCALPASTVQLPSGAGAGTHYVVADCTGQASAASPITVLASNDAAIAYNPVTGQFGAFAAVTLTVPGQSQTFAKTVAGPWSVQ